jgi:elongator complex protein 5
MSLLLPSIIANSQRPHHPFCLLQSSSAQSCLQVLRSVINHRSHKNTTRLILLCFLHPSLSLLDETKQGHQIEVHDYTDKVPGYDDFGTDPRDDILLAVKAGEYTDRSFHLSSSLNRSPPAPPGSLDIIIDSVDTLASDLGSPSQTYKFLFSLISLIRARPSKFILP